MKKNIIFLNTNQFGTLTDSYKWCVYLKSEYNITFITFDNHLKKMDVEGINYIYVHRFKNSYLRGIWYILFSLLYCIINRDPVFIVYFDYCQIFPLICGQDRFHVDIRTLAVTESVELNKRRDEKMRRALSCFKSASYISEGVKDKLHLKLPKEYILPLGADIISDKKKDWKAIRLLYVGTLNHRNIPKTIDGLYDYTQKYGKTNISYDIVGDGDELLEVKEKIRSYNLSDIVTVHGKINYNELYYYFDKNNVGVCFIPQKECYQYQPPTKAYEYILSGLYCIATRTLANGEIIKPSNGIIIDDDSFSFYSALVYIKNNLQLISQLSIRDTLVDSYTWNSIVDCYLKPIIEGMNNSTEK